MELEDLPQEKIKQELIKRILKEYSYQVTETDKNPNMDDFEGYHYKITIKAIETSRQAGFNYSVGLGINDREDLSLFLGLLNCLYTDRVYIEKEELEGLEYEEEKKEKLYNNICKNYDKCVKIGLIDFFNNLNETEQDILNEGF